MKKIHLRRRLTPSPAMVVAVIAVVLALGGTGYAASNAVGGSARHSARHIIKHVAFADNAGFAKSAGFAHQAAHAFAADGATNALNATNATNAANAANATNAKNAVNAANAATANVANGLTGMTRFRTTIQPGGSSFANAAEVTLFSDGPLSLVGKCFSSGGSITAQAFLRSTVAGHWESYDNTGSGGAITPGTDQPAFEDQVTATPPSAGFDDPFDGTFAVIADDQSAYFTGLGSAGVNLGGSGGCTFAGFGIAT